MKPAFLLCLLLIGTTCIAQKVSLLLKTGQVTNVRIKAISTSTIYTSSGSYALSILKSASFENMTPEDQSTYDRLKSQGVEVLFTDSPILLDSKTEEEPNSNSKYANFGIRDSKVIWVRVYEIGDTANQINNSLVHFFAKDGTMKLISNDGSELLYDMEGKTFMARGDQFSGRVLIEIKDQKYRVTISSITRRLGAQTQSLMAIMVDVQNTSSYQMTIEEDVLDKSKSQFKSNRVTKYLDKLNELFLTDFTIKATKKEDW